MAEGSLNMDVQGQKSRIGPDLASFYKCEIVDLLGDDENFLHFSSRTKEGVKISSDIPENHNETSNFSHVSSLFSDSIEDVIPGVERELLKTLLRQSVTTLTQEIDEVFDPVIRIRHVLSCLNSKRKVDSSIKSPVVEDSTTQCCKKLKTSCSNSKGKLLGRDAEKESDVSEDLKLLVESEDILVEEIMTTHSNELHEMLNHMEKQLEEMLNAVVSKCRLMTRQEKEHLRKLIEKLPARNLDRIVEIIRHVKSSDTVPPDEICVDLEGQENTTLWRLYFYVKAVENSRKLST